MRLKIHQWNYGGPTDIWVGSETDIYAVGTKSLHYDGSTWSEIPELSDMSALWGFSSSDVFAVHDRIMHYDGTTWTVSLIPTNELYDIWGSGSEAFAVGKDGTIYHFHEEVVPVTKSYWILNTFTLLFCCAITINTSQI